MEKLYLKQKKVFRTANVYLESCKKKGINIATSSKCFFTSWAKNVGYLNLNYIIGNSKSSFIFNLKDFFSISNFYDLELIGNINKFKKIENLIVSYSRKKNFDKNGNFHD